MTDPNYTHIALVIDRSGSMGGLASDVNGGIRTLLKEQDAEPGTLRVDATTFDTMVETPYVDVPAQDVIDGPDLCVPRGGTALNDAVASTIVTLGEFFENMAEDKRPGHVIVVIATDGEENSSREYPNPNGHLAVKAMVEKQQTEFGWQFIFMGADSIDAFATAAGFGIPQGSTIAYASSSVGTQSVYGAASAGISRSRVGGQSVSFTDDEREAAKEE